MPVDKVCVFPGILPATTIVAPNSPTDLANPIINAANNPL